MLGIIKKMNYKAKRCPRKLRKKGTDCLKDYAFNDLLTVLMRQTVALLFMMALTNRFVLYQYATLVLKKIESIPHRKQDTLFFFIRT